MILKACGMQTESDIDLAVKNGFNTLGFVLYPPSKRSVSKQQAETLTAFTKKNHPEIIVVAVAMNASEIIGIEHCFDFLQINDQKNEQGLIIWQNISHRFYPDIKIYHYDQSCGSGQFAGFPAKLRSVENLIVAGGLNYQNIREIVTTFQPLGVDVASGIETANRKDGDLMQKFIQEITNE